MAASRAVQETQANRLNGSAAAVAITSSVSDTAMIHAVMAFATTLGIDVCAEGVEREEQLAQLRAVGCHRGQGFYFSGPLPAATISAMIETDPMWSLGFWDTYPLTAAGDD